MLSYLPLKEQISLPKDAGFYMTVKASEFEETVTSLETKMMDIVETADDYNGSWMMVENETTQDRVLVLVDTDERVQKYSLKSEGDQFIATPIKGARKGAEGRNLTDLMDKLLEETDHSPGLISLGLTALKEYEKQAGDAA